MKLKYILIASFLLIAVSVGIVGVVLQNSVGEIETSFNKVTTDSALVFPSLLSMETGFHRMQRGILLYALTGNGRNEVEFAQGLQLYQVYKEKIIEAERYESSVKWAEFFDKIETTESRLVTMFAEVVELKDSGALEGTDLANLPQIEGLKELEHGLQEILQDRINYERRELKEQQDVVVENKLNTRTLILSLIVFEIFLAIVLGLLVSSIISKPISSLTTAVDRISRGDFKAEIRGKSNIDEINVLQDSLSRTIASMKLAVLEIKGRGRFKPKKEDNASKKE